MTRLNELTNVNRARIEVVSAEGFRISDQPPHTYTATHSVTVTRRTHVHMATITNPSFPFSFTTFLHMQCVSLTAQWKLKSYARANTKKQTEKHANINYSYLSITLKGPKSVLFSIGRELSTAQLPAVDTLVIITSNMAKLTTKGSQEPVDPGPECRKCYFANQGLGNAFRV